MSNIFNFVNNAQNINNTLNSVNQIKNMLNGNNVEQIATNLMQRNPQFAQFVQQCKGKSLNEICNMYGLDFNAIQQVIKK